MTITVADIPQMPTTANIEWSIETQRSWELIDSRAFFEGLSVKAKMDKLESNIGTALFSKLSENQRLILIGMAGLIDLGGAPDAARMSKAIDDYEPRTD